MATVVRLLPSKRPVRPGPPARRPGDAPEPLWREAVGRQLRDERHRRGERIADVADRAGISPQYLSELERGRKEASSEMLSAVAGALDLTVRDLVAGSTRHLSPTGRRASVTNGGGLLLAA